MTSNRPYLIRALYEWIIDNNFTPHILVDDNMEGIDVPAGLSDGGRIVLNISPKAVRLLEIGNEYITFSARFSGKPCQLTIPVEATLAIYARENGRGMIFPDSEESSKSAQDAGKQDKKAHLKLVE
jgi:stringent starvation protein B